MGIRNAELRNAYQRQWYHDHKESERVKRTLRHAERMAEDPDYIMRKNAYQKNYRSSHPEAHRNYILRTKYNMTQQDYDDLLAFQGGVCALCGKPPTEGHILHVDHDHETDTVRGLCHFSCNYALGRLGDTVGRIEHVLDYLNYPPARRMPIVTT
jgi:hypothetical protein